VNIQLTARCLTTVVKMLISIFCKNKEIVKNAFLIFKYLTNVCKNVFYKLRLSLANQKLLKGTSQKELVG